MKKIILQKGCYNLDAVKKCIYWYSDRLSFDLKVNSSENLEIHINSISVSDQNILTKDLIREIKSDLIDFELRQIIYQETKVIKELLIAKAFAPTDKYENEPPGEVSDPVGYKPE